MAVIIGVLQEELERLRRSERLYLDRIESLPKGSIQFKKVKEYRYPYLRYRCNGRICEDYLKGFDEAQLQDLKLKIEQRKYYEAVLKDLRSNLRMLESMLEVQPSDKKEVPAVFPNSVEQVKIDLPVEYKKQLRKKQRKLSGQV